MAVIIFCTRSCVLQQVTLPCQVTKIFMTISKNIQETMITLILHLYDNTDNPKRSQQNGTEPIYLDRNEHVVELFCGDGLQTIKWLTLTSAHRLKQLRKTHGRLRLREAYLGIDCDFLMPSSIDTKRRGVDENDADILPLKNPYAKIKDVFQDQDHVWINFDERGGAVTKWKRAAYHLNKELVIPKAESPKRALESTHAQSAGGAGSGHQRTPLG